MWGLFELHLVATSDKSRWSQNPSRCNHSSQSVKKLQIFFPGPLSQRVYGFGLTCGSFFIQACCLSAVCGPEYSRTPGIRTTTGQRRERVTNSRPHDHFAQDFFSSSVADVALKARSLHEHKQKKYLYKGQSCPMGQANR